MNCLVNLSSVRRPARADFAVVVALSLTFTGCGEGQQSNLATKMKVLLGGQSANPTTTAETDPQKIRQNKLNELHKKAEAGDVLAMVELGHAYEEGRSWRSGGKFGGTPIEESGKKSEGRDLFAEAGIDPLVDLDKAADWYEKAAGQGNAEAQYRFGRLLTPSEINKLLGVSLKGRPADAAKAAVWFEKAAAQGHAIAQFALGMMYGNGDGIPKDKNKFKEWIQKAAAQGVPDAQNLVAAWYSEGYLGVTKDAAKAVEWWQKAAVQGHALAQLSLGQAYRDGKGVSKDAAKAAEWFGKSAAQGLGVSQAFLGEEYADSKGVIADSVLAYAWLNLASGNGYEPAGETRDSVAWRMTPAEIAEAQRLCSNWKPGQTLARESSPASGAKQPSAQGSLTKKATGTVFVVGKSGHAITNKHVTDGCVELRIEGRDGVVKHVTEDAVNDLALVQIPGEVKAAASIANDPAKLRQGEDIVVFGFPLNSLLSSGGNLTPGVVSAMTGLGNNTNQIQITAPIQPGSSGSPVMNKKGEVVGVVSMKLSDSKMAKVTGSIGQNVNFAVSGQTLRTFLDTHKVEYRSGGVLSFEKSTVDLADEARKWTLVVECWK